MAPNPHQRALVKLIERHTSRYHTWDIFRDFVECAALSMANAVDLSQRETREARYLQVVQRYDHETVNGFAHMLGELIQAQELEDGPRDILGQTFHALEIHDKWKGQFFTPWDLAYMIGRMTVGNAIIAELAAKRFLTVQEPACGGGVMIFGLVQAMRDAGVDIQRQLHVTAIDVDPTCVYMCYLQCALWHIPAVVIRGNTLSLETHESWYTPAHILGGWDWRLRRRDVEPVTRGQPDVPDLECLPEMPAAELLPDVVPVGPRREGALQLALF